MPILDPSDYTPSQLQISLNKSEGPTEYCGVVNIIDDTVAEMDESFNVLLAPPSSPRYSFVSQVSYEVVIRGKYMYICTAMLYCYFVFINCYV